jgi:glycosyltransferase involved in cell wall biosynthesis
VGDLGDLVRSGVNGYLVDAEDRAAFVRRVKELLRDGELWQRLSRAATESARAGNGLDRVADLWARHLPTVGVVAPPGLDTANA